MLVLERKKGQKVLLRTICGDIEVCVSGIANERVKLTFRAPDEVKILRGELVSQKQA